MEQRYDREMNDSAYFVLANNAALLLAMGVIYDALILSAAARIPGKPIVTGTALGMIGIALMLTPLPVAEGVIIDSRSILLATTGLFFGWIPTSIAVVITSLFRLYEGGAGVIAGIVFIVFSAAVGLIWREVRMKHERQLSWRELYLFGIVVHVGMLANTQLFLPEEVALGVTQAIAMPVLLIFPLGTVMLCMLLNHQRSRKQTEERLRASEERSQRNLSQLQATLSAIPDLMFELDIEGRYLSYHASDESKLAAPAHQLLGNTVYDVLPHSEADLVIEALQEAHRTGRSHGAQITLPLMQQTEACFELSVARKQESTDSNPRFIVLSRDITDRKRAEQELHIAATAFNSQEGMIITDASHTILRVNNAFTEVTGYEPEEAIGRTPSLLQSGRHDEQFYRNMMDTLERNRFWQGEIWNKRKNGEIYPEWLTITTVTDEQGEITNYVAAFLDITQRKQAEADIHTLAFYDALTGLPNRRLLLDRLEQALLSSRRRNKLGALMFIDLDNFKTLNDTRGHDVGDSLLVEVAKRLKSCVREMDTVARLGGDEFIVVLEDLSVESQKAAQDAELVAEKIVNVLHQPYPLKDSEYMGTASVGISLFSSDDKHADDLLKRADLAMYQAKESGRNTLRFFDPRIQQELYAQAEMESELRRALAEKQLTLHYQAQCHHHRIIGAEVLLRWEHPEKGMLPPNSFIPLAEQSGLIIPIGTWVLERACRQLKVWREDPAFSALTLSVNVSAHQFAQPDFVETVERILTCTGVDPHRLKLELTESSVLNDINDTVDKMTRLKSLGINFAIDDFGTGYSSLYQLKNLPVDQLKIDRSFIRDITQDPDDLAIVQAIIAMANNLGIDVIAEGVETEAQKHCLEVRNCNDFQGFLFSRPVPLEQFQTYAQELLTQETA